MEKAFLLSEANMKLSGWDPNKNDHYLSIKRRLLEGTLTHEQAIAEILAFYAEQKRND